MGRVEGFIFILMIGGSQIRCASSRDSEDIVDSGELESDASVDTSYVVPDPLTNGDYCYWEDEGDYYSQEIKACDEISQSEVFYGQDGHYQFPYRQHSYSNNGDGTVTDNVTGMMWMSCLLGTDDFEEDFTCANPNLADDGNWGMMNEKCSSQTLGGYDDWRLPSIRELWSLLDANFMSPSLDATAFPNAPQISLWTSTPLENNPEIYWYILLEASHIRIQYASETAGALCVRGPEWPRAYFEIQNFSGDSLAVDLASNMMWMPCPVGQSGASCEYGTATDLIIEEALTYCESLELGGFDDWRLPDRHEMLSVIDYSRLNPAVDPYTFPNTPKTEFLTSTMFSVGYFYCVDMMVGISEPCTSLFVGRVRCVRGGEQ